MASVLLLGRTGLPRWVARARLFVQRCDAKVQGPVRSERYYWVTPDTGCDRPNGHDGEHRNDVTRTIWGDSQAIGSGS